MSDTKGTVVGSLVRVFRYPVKSMVGEELEQAQVTKRGILGDRAYALVDQESGKVVSAKNPRKWSNLFGITAAFAQPPHQNEAIPNVRITLPSGEQLDSVEEVNDRLSNLFDRQVRLLSAAPQKPALEEYWPDIEGLDHRDAVTDEGMPAETFFDCGTLLLMTTATLDRLQELYDEGTFDVRRFRPNLLVDSNSSGFPENEWIGRRVAIGDEVIIEITGPCPRCVMTTIAQPDLPKDPLILRTAVQHNDGNAGVYASVLQGGQIRQDDPVGLL
ncbi:MAG: MOSC domain-containing protein [Proteobacteria bacterium]|nr:MOSC domain-containing protein [Pseudomonadota bacterium]